MRPILVEANTRQDARKAWAEEFAAQKLEEQVFAHEYEAEQRETALTMHMERKGEDYKMMMREAHAYKGDF